MLATGVTTTVRDFVKLSFEALDIGIKFEGEGINEVGLNDKGDVIVKINSAFFRPAEVDLLIGDASKAKQKLGWSAKTDLKGLCDMMIKADLRRIEAGFEF